ncbi:MAG: pyridoxamine 5'-phosphate oxidase family protein [Actinomycetota bacterium]
MSTDEWSPQGPVAELSDTECWALLDGTSLGRLGVSVDSQPEIFPVDYHADGSTVLFRTASGTKLHELLKNDSVVFEVDSRVGDAAWSVTVKGRAIVLTTPDDIDAADRRPLPEWHPTKPFVYVTIVPSTISGRRLNRHVTAEIAR